MRCTLFYTRTLRPIVAIITDSNDENSVKLKQKRGFGWGKRRNFTIFAIDRGGLIKVYTFQPHQEIVILSYQEMVDNEDYHA